MVYIHVRDEAQREDALRIQEALAKRGIQVSGVKVVSAGPASSDLRYFRASEADEAAQVARALRDAGVATPRLKHVSGYESSSRARQYELWLTPSARGDARAAHVQAER